MTGAIHPWRRIGALLGWKLVWHDGGPRGLTLHEPRKISLRRDEDPAHRRSAALHECLHAERGPVPTALDGREEQRVRRETARLLLPDVKVVGEAMAWALSIEEAADELWVSPDVLRDRLRWLHPAERHYLRRRLEHLGD